MGAVESWRWALCWAVVVAANAINRRASLVAAAEWEPENARWRPGMRIQELASSSMNEQDLHNELIVFLYLSRS